MNFDFMQFYQFRLKVAQIIVIITSVVTAVQFLDPMVDVSAKGNCTINPVSPATLTLTVRSAALPNGSINVMYVAFGF